MITMVNIYRACELIITTMEMTTTMIMAERKFCVLAATILKDERNDKRKKE